MVTKTALKTSTTLSASEKTPAQLVTEQHNAGVKPGPKETPLQLDHVTKLESEDAIKAFVDTATRVANDAKQMICAGVVCYLIGRHFARGMKPQLSQVKALLLGRLSVNANKSMSTLYGWIAVSQDIYTRMVSPDEKNYGGVINDIRVAKDVQSAAEIVFKHLSKQMIAAGDGKEYPATDSIDLMKAWSVYTPDSKPKEKTRADQQNAAGKTISRAIEDVVDNTKATSEEVAKLVVNNMASSKVKALDLVNASLARMEDSIQSIEALCIQQFARLCGKDREAARKILADMTAYLASADKAAAEAPLKPVAAPSPTATPENTALAKASNTAKPAEPVTASGELPKPAKAKGKRAA